MSDKRATTLVPIHDLIARRWSGRAFDPGKSIHRAQILALLEAGKRVGITSNSHKVISNLLEAVCEAADEAGVRLGAIQNLQTTETRHLDIRDHGIAIRPRFSPRPRHRVALLA